MNQQQLIEIHNAKNRITTLSDLHNSFLEFTKARPVPNDLPSKLEFAEQSILVRFADHKAEAMPRLIKTPDENFSIEYVFLVKDRDLEIEVWRFYLLSGGKLAESPVGEVPICDFNNPDVAKILCGHVLRGMLHSELFTIYPIKKAK